MLNENLGKAIAGGMFITVGLLDCAFGLAIAFMDVKVHVGKE